MSRRADPTAEVLVPAGIVSRTLAAVIDSLVALGLTALVLAAVAAGVFLVSPITFRWPPGLAGQALLAFLVVATGYLAVGWAIAGWTVGGAVLGVRVVALDGDRLGWLRCGCRAVLCVVVPLGLLWAAVSVNRRSVQDVVVRSAVVYDRHGQPARERPGPR